MKVLSLFDGISCGMIALERAEISVNRYVAFEIDKSAIKISKKNYPQIEHYGDVITADFTQYKDFDLLIGGSPCQDLSSMGSHKGLKGEKSKLFFEFVRALKEVQPKYFLFENNASMSKENQEIISSYLGVQPIFINSSVFSAQNRKRLYWTNIIDNKYLYLNPNINKVKTNIFLKDIIDKNINRKDITEKVNNYLSINYNGRKIQKTVKNGIKNLNEKSNCITTNSGSVGANSCLILKYNEHFYLPTINDFERLQTLPDNYCIGLSRLQALKCIGNCWTVDVIAFILRGIKQ